MSNARSLRTVVLALVCVGAAAFAPIACGSDETEGSGGSGATSSGTSDNTGGTGNTGNSSTGATGNAGGGATMNQDCPTEARADACLLCLQENCTEVVTACCDQDTEASPEFGCYDLLACAQENGCSDSGCVLEACPDVVMGGGADAISAAQDAADCIQPVLDAGMCPDCPGGGGGAGGGG